MRLVPLVTLLVVVACGGSSQKLDASRGDGSNGGDAGAESGGGGGTAGTAGSAGKAGAAAGMTGGAGAQGGATGATGGVGNGGTTGTEPTGGSAGSGATPSITSCTEEFPFAGMWEGSVLDLYFEPLESVRLVVTPDDLGGYQGTLTIGSGDPPPPATSADEPYPNLEFWGMGGAGPVVELWRGFSHTVVRGAGCDDMLRVGISSAEPWGPWCSLQEPVYTDGFGWACTVQSSAGGFGDGRCAVGDGRGGVLAEYPMWKCFACGAILDGEVCACSESGCSFNQTPTDTYLLTLIDDGILSGPDPRCGDCTVRLERVE